MASRRTGDWPTSGIGTATHCPWEPTDSRRACFPGNGIALAGSINRFTDTALDAQYQYLGDDHLFSVQTTWIHEKQRLDASFAAGAAANPSDTLNTFRLGGSYYYRRRYGAALGYFTTTGSTDAGLYNAGGGPVTGSVNNSPDSRGWVAELDYLPWQNVKFALQYTIYSKFNGGTSNYDGFRKERIGQQHGVPPCMDQFLSARARASRVPHLQRETKRYEVSLAHDRGRPVEHCLLHARQRGR
jgi:hypothetical protein